MCLRGVLLVQEGERTHVTEDMLRALFPPFVMQVYQDRLNKIYKKQEELEAKLTKLQKTKQEIEAKQIMDAFKKSGKSMHELMIFLEG